MLSGKDVSLVYETLLASPGMNETVKITMQVPRKNVLLLSKVIEAGLASAQEVQDGILNVAGKDVNAELKDLSNDLLAKAGLMEMNDKLNSLQAK
ncbi:MAG: hypothetical protein V4717_21055 [Bacteroidota bacterium]